VAVSLAALSWTEAALAVSSTPSPARPRAPTIVIGVVGGIASGKSEVARRLAGPDGLVLSADAIAHEVLASGELRELLLARFGPRALDAEGRPDRAFLAERVFAPGGEADRGALEGWTHPRVRARIMARLEQARADRVPRVVLDVPLLLEHDAEHGFARACDALVFVEVDEAERERRARSARGWSRGELARREALQLPLAEKRRRAAFHLSNQRSLSELDREIERVLHAIDPG
jgi:dephospho-CoA kinase